MRLLQGHRNSSIAQILVRVAVAGTILAVMVAGMPGLRGQEEKPTANEEAAKNETPKETEQPSASEKKEDKEKEPPREILLQAEKMFYDGKAEKTRFTGNVTIRQKGEDFTLKADTVIYDEETDTAETTGNLKMFNEDTTITGDLIVADFDERRATITGHVVLTSHGTETKGDAEEDKGLTFRERYKKKKTVVTCDRIDYWYREKRAEATGNLKFTQEDKHGSAKKAIFYEEEDRIVLEDEVTVTNEKGETLRCQRAVIDNKAETIEATGISSTFFLEEEEETEGEAALTEAEKKGEASSPSPKGSPGKGEAAPEEGAKENPPAETPPKSGDGQKGANDKG